MTDLFAIASLWEVLGWTMLHFLWMGCIAFAVAACVRRCVRKFSSQIRYSAALLCLLGVTGTAAAALFLSLQQVGNAVVTSRHESVFPEHAPVESASPLLMEWMQPGAVSVLPAAQTQPANENLTPAEALQHEIFHGTLNLCAQLLPWLWACGTPLVILALLTGIIGTTRLRRRSSEVADDQLQQHLQRLRKLLGISRRVGIAVCDQVTSPLVVGILRPLIVLPPAMLSGLAPAQLEMILLHELAHVRRWDNLVNLLQRMIEALLFYHPVVWWASRWVRLEREHCCDALVLAHNHTPQSYAETLATLALPELAPQFATAAMANHQLTSRICHILNVEERSMSISIRTFFGVIVLLAAGVGGFLLATLRTEHTLADDPDPVHPYLHLIPEDPVTAESLLSQAMLSEAGLGALLVGDEDAYCRAAFFNDKTAWSASQATGPPDVPQAADSGHAWASLTEDDQPEWLRLTYTEPVRAAAVIVYESYNPGALRKVTTTDNDGNVVTLWEGDDPARIEDGKGTAVVMADQILDVSEITIHLDSPAVAGWNEIDAVGLIDFTTGVVHWAESAEASSTYAKSAELTQADDYDLYSLFHNVDSSAACQRCHTGVTRQHRIQQLRAQLQRLEAELALEEALSDQSEQLRLPEFQISQEERKALEAWLNAEGDSPTGTALDDWGAAYDEWTRQRLGESGDDASEESEGFEELRQTLLEQQQALERLSNVLEELQQRLDSPGDSSDGDSDTDSEGVRIQVPGMGPAPQAFDFAFPIESNNVIDEMILHRLNDAGLQDSGETSDEEFIRRIYIDLLGRLPTVEETRNFLENESPEARQELLDDLLQSEESAAHWSEAWSFFFGVQR